MATSPKKSSPRSRAPRDADLKTRFIAFLKTLRGKRLALVLGGAALLFLLTVGGLFAALRIPLPEDVAPQTTTVIAADGTPVGSLTGESVRKDIGLDELPEHVPLAVLAAEDRGFYTHSGVSPTGIARALWVAVRDREASQGGSTITQQYVKNALVGNERTLSRKMKEAVLAIKLEQREDKRTILEWYINTIYWGRGAYGIEAAAKTYFGVTAAELDVNQAATLAGMIQAPEAIDPSEDAERADARRQFVLDGMVEEEWLGQADGESIKQAGLPETSASTHLAESQAPYYLDAVRREVRDALGDRAVSGGFVVHTGLDLRAQQIAEDVVSAGITDPALSGAIVSADPTTGVINALVGGPSFQQQPFNVVDRGLRQTGSTFKAFTLAGFVEAGYHPDSRFDAPASIEVEDKEGGIANYDNQARGRITVYEATAASVNTVFVQMQQKIGTDTLRETAARLGLPDERNGDPSMDAGSTMTLGTDEFTPRELLTGYSTLANGGVKIPPHTVTRIEDTDGNVVWEPDFEPEGVMEANDAYVTTSVLRGVVEGGTGGRANIGRPTAGKTGTTQGGADGWFAGYIPQMVTVTWVGRPEGNEPVEGLSGGGLPAQLWHDYMAQVTEGMEVLDFPEPSLAGYETLNDEPEPCPEGYTRGAPADGSEQPEQPEPGASEPQPAETRTEVLPGTEDDEDGPCIRVIVEEPSETPSESESILPSESELPSVLPTETETSPSPSPSPTKTTGSPSPSPSPSPTEQTTQSATSPSPSPEPTPTESSSG
jgi:penicillin-binding protein 1A